MLAPMLHVENTGYVTAEDGWFYESNNLRSVGSEFIPIPIQNGYGEVTLSGLPFDNVRLEIRDAKCDRVFADLTADYRVVEDENDN